MGVISLGLCVVSVGEVRIANSWSECITCVRVGDTRLVAGSSVALVLDTSCCTGTYVYCTRGSL